MTGPAAALLRRLPWSAEIYQRLRAEPPGNGYRLDRLASALPGWVEAVAAARGGKPAQGRHRVMVFAYLSWWLEHAVALALLLAAVGHPVGLAFLPYRRWSEDVPPFDLRRQAAYLRSVLAPAAGVIRVLSPGAPGGRLPSDLETTLASQSRLDAQYTLGREDVDLDGEAEPLYALRQRRNRRAAQAARAWFAGFGPHTVVVPNGSILEFAAVYHAARHTGLPVVTYEFGEQRERIWLARQAQVMRQDTTGLWQARGATALEPAERQALADLYTARRGGAAWGTFARRWQAAESEGAAAARQRLALDPARPVALVCTNVVGDSLALDRQVFTTGMADWLAETVRRLASFPDWQVIVRVHPGELLGAGHPSLDIVRASLPELPAGFRVVPPDSPINTYDLIGLADVGLVYTSTVGMEMALAGVPVIVAGQTHYRGKGFTADPASRQAFAAAVDRWLTAAPPPRLSAEQVALAERYAYRFFFEYPLPFPWHLIGFWDDIAARPPTAVLEPERLAQARPALQALAGGAFPWEGGA